MFKKKEEYYLLGASSTDSREAVDWIDITGNASKAAVVCAEQDGLTENIILGFLNLEIFFFLSP